MKLRGFLLKSKGPFSVHSSSFKWGAIVTPEDMWQSLVTILVATTKGMLLASSG